MADSETHYIDYDADTLWNLIHQTYVAQGGDLLYPGDEKEILLRSVQACILQAYAVMDNALKMATLTYAVDDYLDLYGEKRNCYRIAAQAATATVSIVFPASGTSLTIPAGTTLTADGAVIYKTVADIAQTGAAQTVTATIEAEEAGTSGNGLTSGTSMHFVETIGTITSITTTSAASGGTDEEDDDTYRERIRTYGLANTCTGSYHNYESVAESVSTQVIDAKATNPSAGNVMVYLILESGSSESTLIAAVLAALSAEDTRPLTDTVSVQKATDIPYVLNVNYTCETAGSITSAVAEAVAEYKEWQENTIGRAFNPDRLMALIYQAGATRVTWGTGSHFNNGTVQYTEITNSQRCSGTITPTDVTT